MDRSKSEIGGSQSPYSREMPYSHDATGGVGQTFWKGFLSSNPSPDTAHSLTYYAGTPEESENEGSRIARAFPETSKRLSANISKILEDLSNGAADIKDSIAGIKFHLTEHESAIEEHSTRMDQAFEVLRMLMERVNRLEDYERRTVVDVPQPDVYTGVMENNACEEWIASMKAHLKSIMALGAELSDHQQVMLISSRLAGHALHYWTSSTTAARPKVCDECLENKAMCDGGEVDTGQACTPCRTRFGPAAFCVFRNDAVGGSLPGNAEEAFKLIEKRFCASKADYLSEWKNIKQSGTVKQLESTITRLFEANQKHLTRNDLKEKFYSSLSKEIQEIMVSKFHFSRFAMNHNLAYAEMVKQAHIAERMLKRPRPPMDPSRVIRKPTTAPIYSENAIPTAPRNHALERFGNGAKMPKKGTGDWLIYCRTRGACFLCGQLDHTSLVCRNKGFNAPIKGSDITSPSLQAGIPGNSDGGHSSTAPANQHDAMVCGGTNDTAASTEISLIDFSEDGW